MHNDVDLEHKGHRNKPGVMEFLALSHQQSRVNQGETALAIFELKTVVKITAIHLRLIHTSQGGIKSFQCKTDIIAATNSQLDRDLNQQVAHSLARRKGFSLVKKIKVAQKLLKVLP